jgi:hypothetical protein
MTPILAACTVHCGGCVRILKAPQLHVGTRRERRDGRHTGRIARCKVGLAESHIATPVWSHPGIECITEARACRSHERSD